MGTYFLDTSAIVKRYVTESGSAWVSGICDPAAGHSINISQATLTEAVAALCRKARLTSISLADRDKSIALFQRDVRRGYSVQRVTTAVYLRAGTLCQSHNLRAYDAIQLACALTLRDRLSALQLSPTFVCADDDLLRVAAPRRAERREPEQLPMSGYSVRRAAQIAVIVAVDRPEWATTRSAKAPTRAQTTSRSTSFVMTWYDRSNTSISLSSVPSRR